MEYIHTDIAGPLPVAGYDGSRYWVTFLDDNTQLSEAIPIVNKSYMFPEFQKFLAKHNGQNVAVIGYDLTIAAKIEHKNSATGA